MLVCHVRVQIELPLRAEATVGTVELWKHAAFEFQVPVQRGGVRIDLLALSTRVLPSRLIRCPSRTV